MASPSPFRRALRPQLYVCAHCTLGQHMPKTAKRLIGQKYLAKIAQAELDWTTQARHIRAGKKKSILSLLEERGYVNAVAGGRDNLDKLMTNKRIGAYVGIDPTAPSLHVGHLLPFMVLFWMYVHGFHTISLVGGATAKIGDPTGRTTSRQAQSSAVRKANLHAMHYQVKALWRKVESYGEKHGYKWEWAWRRGIDNNTTWMEKLSVMELLKVLGPGIRLGTMLSRDTVKNKMENGDGMSFAEFTYPVLQAWDWWYMYNTKHPAIQLQIGGSDQYGNIVAGIDAIKYITKNHSNPELRQEKEDPLMTPYGLTVPLLTTSSGEKFGKSAGNAIWLDKEMTSSFDLYGFFLRSADADVERYLKLFTFLPMETIRSVMEEHAQNPSKRTAQHLLAAELLELVHGKLAAEEAAQQHSRFSGNRSKPTTSTSPTPSSPTSETTSTSNTNTDINRSLNPHAPPTNWENAPSPNTTLPRSLVYGMTFGRILYHAGLVSSYSEGNRLIQKGGVYVGSAPAQIGHQRDEVSFTPAKWGDPAATEQFIIDGQLLILRVGKWKVKVIKIVDDDEFRRMGGSAPGWEALEEEGGKERLRKGAERDYDEARKPVKVRKWKGGNDVPGEPVRSTKRASSEIPVSGFGATHREGGRNEFKSLRGTESEDAPRRPFRASTDSTDESARIRMQASDRPVTIRKHLSEWSGSDGTKGWRNVD